MHLYSIYTLASVLVWLPILLLLRTWVVAIAGAYHQRAFYKYGEWNFLRAYAEEGRGLAISVARGVRSRQ